MACVISRRVRLLIAIFYATNSLLVYFLIAKPRTTRKRKRRSIPQNAFPFRFNCQTYLSLFSRLDAHDSANLIDQPCLNWAGSSRVVHSFVRSRSKWSLQAPCNKRKKTETESEREGRSCSSLTNTSVINNKLYHKTSLAPASGHFPSLGTHARSNLAASQWLEEMDELIDRRPGEWIEFSSLTFDRLDSNLQTTSHLSFSRSVPKLSCNIIIIISQPAKSSSYNYQPWDDKYFIWKIALLTTITNQLQSPQLYFSLSVWYH